MASRYLRSWPGARAKCEALDLGGGWVTLVKLMNHRLNSLRGYIRDHIGSIIGVTEGDTRSSSSDCSSHGRRGDGGNLHLEAPR